MALVGMFAIVAVLVGGGAWVRGDSPALMLSEGMLGGIGATLAVAWVSRKP
jgi:hypothetical protein